MAAALAGGAPAAGEDVGPAGAGRGTRPTDAAHPRRQAPPPRTHVVARRTTFFHFHNVSIGGSVSNRYQTFPPWPGRAGSCPCVATGTTGRRRRSAQSARAAGPRRWVGPLVPASGLPACMLAGRRLRHVFRCWIVLRQVLGFRFRVVGQFTKEMSWTAIWEERHDCAARARK